MPYLGSTNGVEDADPELPRVLARRRVHGCGHERLIDGDLQFGHLHGPELRGRQLDLAQLQIVRHERELIERLAAELHLHLLGAVQLGDGTVQLEIEDRVLPGILEGERRVLLGPLPFDRRVRLGRFRRMPPVLEHGEEVVGLRQTGRGARPYRRAGQYPPRRAAGGADPRSSTDPPGAWHSRRTGTRARKSCACTRPSRRVSTRWSASADCDRRSTSALRRCRRHEA